MTTYLNNCILIRLVSWQLYISRLILSQLKWKFHLHSQSLNSCSTVKCESYLSSAGYWSICLLCRGEREITVENYIFTCCIHKMSNSVTKFSQLFHIFHVTFTYNNDTGTSWALHSSGAQGASTSPWTHSPFHSRLASRSICTRIPRLTYWTL